MKKFLKILIAITCACVITVFATSCEETKYGSKIKNCTIKVNYVKDGEVKERDLHFELYLNLAPSTIEHFVYLAEKSFYNGTTVSNVNGYLEFGAFSYDGLSVKNGGSFNSKLNDYKSIITSEYMSGKYLDKSNTIPRYTENGCIAGEFSANGINGNPLDFSKGALVLKRDYSKTDFDTATATFAVTFGTSSYFDDTDKYVVFGKAKSDDKDGDGISTLDFLTTLRDDYKTEENGSSYWYYSYTESEYADTLDTIGRYFMKDENGDYFARDDHGEYQILLGSEYADLKKEFSTQSKFMQNVPYLAITVNSITF